MENMNLKKREITKEIEIDGRTFLIKKFDPLMGNYIAMKLFTMVLPFGIGDMLKKEVKGSEKLPTATSNAPQMSKADFIEFQQDVLSVCYEVLKGDTAPVVRDNGTYGISDFTSKIALQLLIGSIAFNFSDFFDGLLSNGSPTVG